VNFIDPRGTNIIAVTSCVTQKFEGKIIGIDCETVFYLTGGGPVALPFGGIGDGGIGGGGGPAAGAQQSQQPQQQQQPCSSIANLAGANTDVGLLSRLIFAEATGADQFNRDYPRAPNPDGLSIEEAYIKERQAIAAIVYNRLGHPDFGRKRTISDVITAPNQFQGFSGGRIAPGVQRRINNALNSPIGSNECNDLLAAIYVANTFDPRQDPFGAGMTFGNFATGQGRPRGNFTYLGTFPGAGNTFYGLRR